MVPEWAFEASPSVADGGGVIASAGAGALFIILCASLCCWVTLQASITRSNRSASPGGAATPLFAGGRSSALQLSPASIYALSRESVRLCCAILLTYLFEHYPLFPHAAKDHDMDLFWFLTFGLFFCAALGLQKTKTTDLLNREQTEEWKGWMQFMFLLYHYLHASEVYNSIRVMITCYVWMTGFGNFSFFYIKRDFGLVRLLQMLWRLNFLVLLLMLVQGNTYVLYYICPLHTFYFLFTYATMRVFERMNHTKWLVRCKIFAAALLVYLVWDFRGSTLFDFVFAPVSTEPMMGGLSGARYEWYFRTSLDHWSTLFGMIFALNYPVMDSFFKNVGTLPARRQALLVGPGIAVAVGLLSWWFGAVYSLPKTEYNQSNAYLAIVPLLCYIFLRNFHPILRSYHSPLLHNIGKTTLETYLLQHHVWLTSNAKTLLVLIPDNPKCNMFVVTVMYYYLAKECYRLTMSLRGMFLPNSVEACMRNLGFLAGTLGFAFCVSYVAAISMAAVLPRLLFLAAVGACLAFALLRLVNARNKDSVIFQVLHAQFMKAASIIFVLALLCAHQSQYPDRPIAKPSDCLAGANVGHWTYDPSLGLGECLGPGQLAMQGGLAECERMFWRFDDERGSPGHSCGFASLSKRTAQHRVPRGARFAVIGDSEARNLFFSMRKIFGIANAEEELHPKYHGDMHPFDEEQSSSVQVAFFWAPTASEVRDALAKIVAEEPTGIILSFGLWDALHEHDLGKFAETVKGMRGIVPMDGRETRPLLTWVPPPTIVDARLVQEKAAFMTESQVQQYREAVSRHFASESSDFSVPLNELTSEAFSVAHTTDGIHYRDIYYDVAVQIYLNAVPYAASTAGVIWPLSGPETRPVGGMAHPAWGLGVLLAILVMLVTFDGFAGGLAAPVRIFGSAELQRMLSYDKAYYEVLRSIDARLVAPEESRERQGEGGDSSAAEEEELLSAVENT